MAEAFICGIGGGNATVEHIVITDATSHTFQLNNPKRTHCMVFGSINSNEYTGSYLDVIDGSLECKYRLHGNQYAVYSKTGSRYIYQGTWTWSYQESTEFDKNAVITRNNDSVTIELLHDYYKDYQEGYDSSDGTYYTELQRNNTVDIYVVDYD